MSECESEHMVWLIQKFGPEYLKNARRPDAVAEFDRLMKENPRRNKMGALLEAKETVSKPKVK